MGAKKGIVFLAALLDLDEANGEGFTRTCGSRDSPFVIQNYFNIAKDIAI
jgi:hypothetical protein